MNKNGMPAHGSFVVDSNKLLAHYEKCATCSVKELPCAIGKRLWDKLIAQHARMLEECVLWHVKRFSGPQRAAVMITKLNRILTLLAPTP